MTQIMNGEQVLDVFRECGAVLEGHFILSSGLRSPMFLQKALVFRQPATSEKLCRALAEKVRASSLPEFSQIVSPAVGGIIPGYETARHLNKPAIYTERVDGEFALRRGFAIAPDEAVLIVEDIVSTGLSIRECAEAVREMGGNVVGAACLVDRSGGRADLDFPLISLAQIDIPAYPPEDLPPELAVLPAVKPGSRGLQ